MSAQGSASSPGPRLRHGYRLEGDERTLTLVDGGVVRELIIAVDDERRRLAYAVTETRLPLDRHHASFQVFAEGEGSRLVWITDALPTSVRWKSVCVSNTVLKS